MTLSPLLAALVPALLGWSLLNALLGWSLLLLSIFLILLILVQRGRGGGLAGALGGPGGQSAFGTKAGDLFTRITSFVALGWIALCAFTMWQIGSRAPSAITPAATISASPADQMPANADMIDFGNPGGAAQTAPEEPFVPSTQDAASQESTPTAPAETGTEDAVEPAPATDSTDP